MKSWVKHPWRVTGRLFWLGCEFALAIFNYLIHCIFCPQVALSSTRAIWGHDLALRLLRVFGIKIEWKGNIPSDGLLVCNHLSYLDILIIASLTPCVFVAKSEVKHWPVLGWFAMLTGTLFVHREKRSQTALSVDEIGTALRRGSLVVLFPEGTSSGGETVLPFKSSLLEPAVQQSHPLSVSFLAYELTDGDASEEVCYWKDMTLLPHLINLCSKRGIQASVHFKNLDKINLDRKELARRLHAEIMEMKSALS